jgi:hypothetical protein
METVTMTAKSAASAVSPQPVTAPRTARAAMPQDPQFLVNVRQSELRDHHLARAPVPAPAPRAALEPEALDKGPATTVLPVDAGADSPVVLTRNRALNDTETGGLTSTVNEPSVAASKDGVVLYTGNWFAAISKDNGLSMTSCSGSCNISRMAPPTRFAWPMRRVRTSAMRTGSTTILPHRPWAIGTTSGSTSPTWR